MPARRYAQETTVSVQKSQQELSMVLQRAGADQVVLAWDQTQGTGVRFRMQGRFAQLMVPPPSERRMKELKLWRPRWSDQERLDQEQRRSWRALILLVKAKLEAIAAGITTAEREFMPDLLMEDGRRLEEWALPALETRRLPALPAMGENRGYAAHASPPCQRWMGVPFARGDEYPDLLGPTRELLQRSGLPWVIENIATAPVNGPVLCGLTFGLPVIRHRRFETSPEIVLWPSSLCPQTSWGRGTAHRGCYPFAHGAWRPAWRKYVMPVLWPWMTLEETHDAIPPAYTEWIGLQLSAELKVAAWTHLKGKST